MLKIKSLYLFPIFTFFLVYSYGQKSTIICGTLNQSDKITIQICEPLDGYYNNAYISDSTNSYTKGIDTFYIKTDKTNTKAFYSILISDKESGERIRILNFLVIPGDSINIQFDFTKDDYSFAKFAGDNAKGNMLYSQLTYQPFSRYQKLATIIQSQSNKIQFLNDFNSNYDTIIQSFKLAYQKKEISEAFFSMVSLSINMDLVGYSIDHLFRNNQFTQKQGFDFRDNVARSLINKVLPDSPLWKGAARSTLFLTQLYTYNTISENKMSNCDQLYSNDVEIVVRDTTIKIDKILAHLTYIKPKEVKEVLWFYYLFDIFSFAKGYFTNNEIIKQFEFIFPNSKYTVLLENEFNKRRVKENDTYVNTRPIIILDSIAKFKTLEEILGANFKNKTVFVDLWASWCLPCVSEFVYNEKLDSLLDKNKIEKLYISLDQSINSWVYAINKFKLGGVHVLLNQDLYNNLRKILNFPDSSPIAIPYYFLIGQSGKMLELNLPRPNDKRLEILINKLQLQ